MYVYIVDSSTPHTCACVSCVCVCVCVITGVPSCVSCRWLCRVVGRVVYPEHQPALFDVEGAERGEDGDQDRGRVLARVDEVPPVLRVAVPPEALQQPQPVRNHRCSHLRECVSCRVVV